MAHVLVAGTNLDWDADAEVLRASLAPGARLGRAEAVAVLRAIDGHFGAGRSPRLLVDARGAENVTLMWRLEWTHYMLRQKDARVAIVNASRMIRVLVEAFEHDTRGRARAFGDEKDALAWLGGLRIPT